MGTLGLGGYQVGLLPEGGFLIFFSLDAKHFLNTLPWGRGVAYFGAPMQRKTPGGCQLQPKCTSGGVAVQGGVGGQQEPM